MPNLTIGSRGQDVRNLQTQLEAAGYELGDIDGIFGRRTAAAVRAFQQAQGIRVDGIAGTETAGKLRNVGDTFEGGNTTPVNPARVKSPAEIRQLNNTRVDTQLPDRGYGFQGYYSGSKRWGTERTIETIRTAAARYHEATGQTMRVGDISLRGGGDIDGHASHETGRNVDIDMAFSDGRTDIERNRNSVNATWRSPHYDRAATRRMIQEIKRVNPNIVVLFNDPVLVREGLTRAYPNHDNHLHLQNMN
ncbi:MAG: penicillin-insensitive murein endopeptidase [Myxococcaceae bacterium]|nr:penicillin-insensitive murein endopeptidase [Myxococcaceae bacterium]